MRFERHHLVLVDPKRWPDIVAGHAEARSFPVVVDWAKSGRPLIVRRPLFDDVLDHVPLGLPLPPSLGKRRLAFLVPGDAVSTVAPPPRLADVRPAAPIGWHEVIDAIVALDPSTQCFGSLAWAHMTGLSYLSATSDLDLLWRVDGHADVERLLPMLETIAVSAPMRLDGEVITPAGLAIQWREWQGGAVDLLAKTCDGNRLVARESVFA